MRRGKVILIRFSGSMPMLKDEIIVDWEKDEFNGRKDAVKALRR